MIGDITITVFGLKGNKNKNESFVALKYFVAGRYKEMEDVEIIRAGLGDTKETVSTNLMAVEMDVGLNLLASVQSSLTGTQNPFFVSLVCFGTLLQQTSFS